MRKRSSKKTSKVKSNTGSRGISKKENIDSDEDYRASKKLYECTYIFKNEYYGWAKCYSESVPDIYISYNTNKDFGLMHRDKIQVSIITNPKNRKKSGKVVKIIERYTKTLTGIYNNGIVKPINSKLSEVAINKLDFMDVVNNDEVLVEITEYPGKIETAQGNIINVYKNRTPKETLVAALWEEYNLGPRGNFDNLEKELNSISEKITIEDICNRVNKKNQLVLAIDPNDAKDFDDAVAIKKLVNGNYILSVHIADVSHYVKVGSLLFERASESATSIYIPGKVVPMLPEKLSNNICSLKEGVERLALSIDITFDTTGNVLKSNIYESVIIVSKNMSYDKVFSVISNDYESLEEYREYVPTILLMKELAEILKQKRLSRGSINFNIPQTKVILDELGNIEDVQPYEITIANNIIEEFMLIANETVAKFLYDSKAPAIYRIHEDPDIEKLLLLNGILSDYNIKIKSFENIHPKTISDILNSITDEKIHSVISERILRTLKQARYSDKLLRHFGLAALYYCHFTSPIRRFPDLMVHIILKELIKNNYKLEDKQYSNLSEKVAKYSEISSKQEKEATEIEREFDKLYLTIFMMDKIGDEFEGIISSITQYGIYIKLKNTVEGLIPIDTLTNDQYIFMEEKFMLIGKNTRNVYKIGDTHKVKLIAADPYTRQIDFELILN